MMKKFSFHLGQSFIGIIAVVVLGVLLAFLALFYYGLKEIPIIL